MAWPTLEAHWKMNDDAANSTVTDSEGSNDGTYKDSGGSINTSTGSVTGKINDALDFDGGDEYVDIGDPADLDITGSITIAAWVYLENATTANYAVVQKGDSQYYIRVRSATDKWSFVVNDGSYHISDSDNTAARNTWVHLVGRFDVDTGEVAIWVDGAKQSNTVTSGTITSNAYNLYIGENSEVTGMYFDGQIDDVRIYSGVLDSDQISLIYNSGNGTEDAYPTSGYTLTAGSGSFTTTGQTTNLLAKRLLTAAQGSFTTTGQTINLLAKRLLTAAQGSFTTTGQTTNLLFNRLLTAAQGSFTTTGIDAGLAKVFTLVAEAGSFTFTGIDAGLKATRKLVADAGSFTLTGIDVSFHLPTFLKPRINASKDVSPSVDITEDITLRAEASDSKSPNANITEDTIPKVDIKQDIKPNIS